MKSLSWGWFTDRTSLLGIGKSKWSISRSSLDDWFPWIWATGGKMFWELQASFFSPLLSHSHSLMSTFASQGCHVFLLKLPYRYQDKHFLTRFDKLWILLFFPWSPDHFYFLQDNSSYSNNMVNIVSPDPAASGENLTTIVLGERSFWRLLGCKWG